MSQTTNVSKRVEVTKKEIEELKKDLEKLINNGVNNGKHIPISENNIPVSEHNIPASENHNKEKVVSDEPVRTTLKPTPREVKSATVETGKGSANLPKTRSYNVDKAREYIKQQRDKRKLEQKSKVDINKINNEIRKQKLQELREKQLELVARNVQLKRERSKSRERGEVVRQPARERARSTSRSREPLLRRNVPKTRKPPEATKVRPDSPETSQNIIQKIRENLSVSDKSCLSSSQKLSEKTSQEPSQKTSQKPSEKTSQKLSEKSSQKPSENSSQKSSSQQNVASLMQPLQVLNKSENFLRPPAVDLDKTSINFIPRNVEKMSPREIQHEPLLSVPSSYNFINSVKRKLELALDVRRTTDKSVQNSLNLSAGETGESKVKKLFLEAPKELVLKSPPRETQKSVQQPPKKQFLEVPCEDFKKPIETPPGSFSEKSKKEKRPNLSLEVVKKLELVQNKSARKLNFDTDSDDSDSGTSKNIPELSSESAKTVSEIVKSGSEIATTGSGIAKTVSEIVKSGSEIATTGSGIAKTVSEIVKSGSENANLLKENSERIRIISGCFDNQNPINQLVQNSYSSDFNSDSEISPITSVTSKEAKSKFRGKENKLSATKQSSSKSKSENGSRKINPFWGYSFKSLAGEEELSSDIPSVPTKSSLSNIEENSAPPTFKSLSSGEEIHCESSTVSRKTQQEKKIIVKKTTKETLNKTNEIHLKFEAEVHLLNDFNESLKQFMAVEKAYENIKNNSPQKILQNIDTQTSIITKNGEEKAINMYEKSHAESTVATSVNFSRGSGESFDELIGFNDTDRETTASSVLEVTKLNDASSIDGGDNLNVSNCTGLSLKMFEQLIKDEDARFENLRTIIRIRERSLLDRTRGELTWLEIQRKQLIENGKLEEASLVKKKQRGILLRHEQEKNEMKKLKQMQKTKSQERKNILKQQRSLIKSQLSTKNMITKMKVSTLRERRQSGPLKVIQNCSESIKSETSISTKKSSGIEEILSVTSHSLTVTSREDSDSFTENSNPPVGKTNNEIVDARRSLHMREVALEKRKKEAEDLLQWHQKLLEKEKEILELETIANNIIRKNKDLEKRKISGKHLNQLWNSMTDGNDQQHIDSNVYSASHIGLEKLRKSARNFNAKNNKISELSEENTPVISENVENDYSLTFESDTRTDNFVTNEEEEEEEKISSLSKLMDNFSRLEDEIFMLNKHQDKEIEEEKRKKSEEIEDDILRKHKQLEEEKLRKSEEELEKSTEIEEHELNKSEENEPVNGEISEEIKTNSVIEVVDQIKFNESEPVEKSEEIESTTQNFEGTKTSATTSVIEILEEEKSEIESLEEKKTTIEENLDEIESIREVESEIQEEVIEELPENSVQSNHIPISFEENKLIVEENDLNSEESSLESEENRLKIEEILEINLENQENERNDQKIQEDDLNIEEHNLINEEHNLTNSEDNLEIEENETKSSEDEISEEISEERTEKIDVKQRVSEILADAYKAQGDKSPRLQDLYVTAYDVISPRDSPESNESLEEGKLNLFGSEAEELLKKQLAIEQEIKQIEQQQKEHLPYIFMREIPNKPPPPYTPPTPINFGTPSSILPTDPKETREISNYSANILFKSYQTNNLANVKFSENTFKLASTINIGKTKYEFLFNICRELAVQHYSQFKSKNELSWMDSTKKQQLTRNNRPFDAIALNKYLNNKLDELFGFKKSAIAESAIIKWSRKKRDHVDEILVLESQEEESQWIHYDEDELLVKDQLVNDLMKNLLDETASVFKKIIEKKKVFY